MTQLEETQPQSKLPFIALILSFSSLLFGCISFVVLYFVEFNFDLYRFVPDQYFFIFYRSAGSLALCLSCVGILAPMGGIVTGGISLVRGQPKKFISILAILAGLIFIVVLGLLALITFFMSFVYTAQ